MRDARGIRVAPALFPAAVLILVLLALAGCGSDGSERETTDAPLAGGGSTTSPAETGGDAGATRRPEEAEAPARPGGTDTGDEVVDGFGVEAGGSAREQIVAAARAYFSARAADRWGAACRRLSASSRRTVTTAARRFAERPAAKCPEGLAALQEGVSRGLRAEAAEAELVGVRVKGDNAFYVYRIPNGTDALLTMVHEDGEWRAAALAGTLLPKVPGR